MIEDKSKLMEVADQLKALREDMRKGKDALDHVYVRGCAEGLRKAEELVRKAADE